MVMQMIGMTTRALNAHVVCAERIEEVAKAQLKALDVPIDEADDYGDWARDWRDNPSESDIKSMMREQIDAWRSVLGHIAEARA